MKIKNKKLFSLLSLFVLFVLSLETLSACQKAKVAQKNVTLANWSQLIVEQTNLLAEEKKGFFKEKGIDLKIIPGKGGQDALKNMLADKADVALSDPGAVYSALAQGEDLVILYTVYPQNVFNVITKDEKIQSPKDLKGKKIGIYSRASGTYQNLLVLLHQAGISEKDVELLEVGISNFGPLLQGHVDATAATDTALASAKNAGLTDAKIFNVKDSLNIPSDFFVMKRSTYEKNKELYKNFVKAYEKSAQWMMDHPDEAVEVAADKAIDGQDKTLDRKIIDLRNKSSLSNDGKLGEMDKDLIQKGADAYYQLGLIKNKLDMNKFIISIED
ncbi:ABC transporter substrate-binding protein [Aerococcus christensenii]|uniref:ABC transporter substrate-binding protein n=1 Tax=Aerococcus christensenii TaxID=87541 RepID=UPI0023A91BE9|nr:ABC transporter substrate-binding protein [Aerococcus christensenii]WEB71680.1 ABC transporter substrate-binding protein [Aerococcus christensenii]